MKKLLTLALMVIAMNAYAQENKKTTIEVPQWVKNIKFSGYGMLQYQGEDKEGDRHNEFNLRLLRLILDGKIGDFDWRAQIQGTSNAGPGNPTVMLVDLYTEWAKYTPPTPSLRAGIRMQWSLTICPASETVLVKRPAEAVTSACKYKATCSPIPTVVACCTTKWVSITVKVLTPRIKTTRRTSLADCGSCLLMVYALVPLAGQEHVEI